MLKQALVSIWSVMTVFNCVALVIVEGTMKWGKRKGRGEYIEWDDVILPWPKHSTSYTLWIMNFYLKTTIRACSDRRLIHRKNTLWAEELHESVVTPSQSLTQSSGTPPGQTLPTTWDVNMFANISLVFSLEVHILISSAESWFGLAIDALDIMRRFVEDALEACDWPWDSDSTVINVGESGWYLEKVNWIFWGQWREEFLMFVHWSFCRLWDRFDRRISGYFKRISRKARKTPREPLFMLLMVNLSFKSASLKE